MLSAIASLPQRLRALPLPHFPTLVPKRLYPRTIIIIAAPIVLLLSILTIVTMERHLQRVTEMLSSATAKDIGMLVDLYQRHSHVEGIRGLVQEAAEKLELELDFLPHQRLPSIIPQHFFNLLDRALNHQLTIKVGEPHWINTQAGNDNVEIRILLEDEVMRVFAPRRQTYPSNSHIIFAWMLGSSSVLLIVAVLFLRNQIKPILQLADAAERFGKGLPPSEEFRVRGALEVRKASLAFIRMRDRIERHVEQRTTMLAAVSHDLRTILARFKLELALSPETPEINAMRKDVDEMQSMINAYLEFARGEGNEQTAVVDVDALLEEIRDEMARMDRRVTIGSAATALELALRPNAFKRALTNLVVNATRHADAVELSTEMSDDALLIHVDDNGPGIPPDMREKVFQPFFRLDNARTQRDGASTGLGLSIARDIVHSHGGSLTLADSHLGGLRATISVPL
jgi:two-component system osmolarity sensor histidine kinase EnvZ